MPFNGSGTFVRVHDWTDDAANDIPITASRMDAEFDGIATALSSCLTQDGQNDLTGTLNVTGTIDTTSGNLRTSLVSVRDDAGTNRDINFQTGGDLRWKIRCNNTSESGSDAGSDLIINAYDDDGNFLATSLFIQRSDGAVNVSSDFFVNGIVDGTGVEGKTNGDASARVAIVDGQLSVFKAGAQAFFNYDDAGSSGGPNVQFRRNGSVVGSVTNDGSNASFNTSSDRRLKEDLAPYTAEDAAAVIDGLDVRRFRWTATGKESFGVYAQDAYEVAPHAVTPGGDDPHKDPWSVDPGKLIWDLVQTVKDLRTRVAALENGG